MTRIVVLAAAAGALLAACEEEHGAAPRGQFEPAGRIDARGNAATERALLAEGAGPGRGSAEPPAEPPGLDALLQEWVGAERADPTRTSDRYDAGGAALAPGAGELQVVTGRLRLAGEDAIEVAPPGGEPVRLRLPDGAPITWGGSLVSREALEEGGQVRARYSNRTALGVDVLHEPPAAPPAAPPPAPGRPPREGAGPEQPR